MTKNNDDLFLPFELVTLHMLATQIGCPVEAIEYYFAELKDDRRVRLWVQPFKMKVRNKVRQLYNTEISLKKVIQGINTMLSKVPLPSEFNGSVVGKSIKDNASPHIGNPYLVKIDVKNFFPSVHRKEIKKIFIEIGCSSKISNIITRLVSFDKHTPQGYPTSSSIANLFIAKYCYPKIKQICQNAGYVFSIWVDDIAISSKNPIKEQHIQEIIKAMESTGLRVHRRKKLKRLGPSKRKVVTGIVTNEKMNLCKKWVRELDLKLYLVKNYGLATLAEKRCNEEYKKSIGKAKSKRKPIRTPEQWSKDHLAGLLYFARHINIEKFNKMVQKHKIIIAELKILNTSTIIKTAK